MASGDDPISGPTDPTGSLEGVPRTGRAIVVSTEPDVCLDAGGSPVAFNIWALPSDDAQTAATVRLTSLRTHTHESLITACFGDEAGVGGGVRSGTHDGICEPKTWSATVYAEGRQVVRHSDAWWMNNRNTTGKVYYVRDTELRPRWWAEQGRATQARAGGDGAGGSAALGLLAPSPAAPGEAAAEAEAAIARAQAAVAEARAATAALEAEVAAAEASAAGAVETESEGGLALSEFGPLEWLGAGVVVGLTAAGGWYAVHTLRRRLADARRRQEEAQRKLDEAKGAQSSAPSQPQPSVVRVTGSLKTVKDEICEMACQCKADRGGARTLTDCVAEKLRRKYYDPGGPRYPDGSPRRPSSPTSDGPRPEVSYDPANGFKPVESGSEPGMPSSQAPIKGAPRPDISWWQGGKLWKIFELKFGDDRDTEMQRNGLYEEIAEHNGLDPKTDLVRMNVDTDCECTPTGGKAK